MGFNVVAFDLDGTLADTARAAKVPFVAVSFGFSDRPVEQLDAVAIIDSFQDFDRAMLHGA